jgi:type I restriction enzyme, S subunit
MPFDLSAASAIIRQTGIPDGWSARTVSELVQFASGGTPDRNECAYWRDGSIPWITPTDLSANSSKYISSGAEFISEAGLQNCNATLVPVGSIVFSTRGTVGNLAISAVPLTTNQSCEILVPRSAEDSSDFLYYALNFGMNAFHRLAGGTTFGAITRRDIGRVLLAVPTPSEQAAIARVLDSVDTAIEQVRAVAAESMKFERTLIANDLQRVTCQSERLGVFATDIRYGTSVAASERGWGKPVLRIPNVVGNRLILDDLAYVELSETDSKRLTLQDGDLLIVRTNGNPSYVGRSVVFWAPDDRTWVYASYLIRVRLNGDLVPEYVNIYLGSERGRRELLRRVTTSAGNNNINSNSIKLLSIPVPKSKDDQLRIVELARACREKTDALQSNHPPAKPGAFRSLAPQRGLIAIEGVLLEAHCTTQTPSSDVLHSKVIASFRNRGSYHDAPRTVNRLPEMSNLLGPPAKPGVFP